MELWDKQLSESSINYEAFCIYRDMGTDRSYEKVSKKVGKNENLISSWGRKYEWVKRAEAYDAYMEKREREAVEKKRIADVAAMRQRHADLALAMLVKAAGALKNIPEEDIKAGDISRMVDVASKLERLSRGDVGDVIEERDGGKADSPVAIYNIPSNGRDEE